ncbi:MAG: EAL domain-containing protein [Rubrivivax sp.]|nr:EAL domain-containing protein [Rubrivivax sp.]
MDLHPLLERQLRRLGLDAASGPTDVERWTQLLHGVGRAYREAEQDRYLLERAQDISSRELHAQAEQLRLNEARLASLLGLSTDWVWEQDKQHTVTYVSEGWEAATGLRPSVFLGTGWLSLDRLDAADEVKLEYRRCVGQRLPFRDLTVGMDTPRGKRFFRLAGQPLLDDQGEFVGYRGVGSDATEATLASRRAEQMARFDTLTNLPNRNMLNDALRRALARARRQGTRVAVAFIDLDGFKHINDNLGHAAGDELLRVMAQRLEQTARAGELVARLGGDEFVMVVENAGPQPALVAMGKRVIEVLGTPVRLQDRDFRISGSVGMSVFPQDAEDGPTMLRNADAAMYEAKKSGAGQLNFYTADLATRAAESFSLETELREALARDELVLHYQPKFRLSGGALAGVEALVRWQHPQRGLLAPGDFIPLAEQRGLILPIGRWVMAAACRQMRAWKDAGREVGHCAVNLSAHHFTSEHLVEEVVAALARSDVAASALEIEVTESAVMIDPARAHRVMTRLSDLGVRIAIDDFGTGHSSLAYLKRFPARTLKIDRSFVRGLPDDANDIAITQAVVAMARSLGLETVAEGVETPAQLEYLRRIGCDEAQGYLLGRPVAAAALAWEPLTLLSAPCGTV